jgi:four helix bundle protein
MTAKRFEDLEVWQKARAFMSPIYELGKELIDRKDYELRNQIVRASMSIMLNIAEGFARRSNNEFRQFLYIAHGSAAEVQSCLYIAKDQHYCDEPRFQDMYGRCDEISRMIAGLIKYLNTLK